MPWASARSSAIAVCTSPLISSIMPIGVFGVVLDRVVRQTEFDRQCDEVLLGAVVQVAFELAPLGVAGGHDAGTRVLQLLVADAQLVEAGLERGVELHVVQRQADLAGDLGEHGVLGLGEGLAVGPAGRPR